MWRWYWENLTLYIHGPNGREAVGGIAVSSTRIWTQGVYSADDAETLVSYLNSRHV